MKHLDKWKEKFEKTVGVASRERENGSVKCRVKWGARLEEEQRIHTAKGLRLVKWNKD